MSDTSRPLIRQGRREMSAPRLYMTDPFRPPALYHQLISINMFSDPVSSSTWYFHCVVYACALTPRLRTIYSDCYFEVILSPTWYGWPFVAKFNNVYFYASIYIDPTSTQDILIQRLYWFNFDTGYFCARQIFIQLQRPKLCFRKRIYIFNFNKWKIFSFNKTYLFNSSSSRTSINSYSTKLHLPIPLPPLP